MRSTQREVAQQLVADLIPGEPAVTGSLRLGHSPIELRRPGGGPPRIAGLFHAVEEFLRKAKPIRRVEREGFGGDDVEGQGHADSIAPTRSGGDARSASCDYRLSPDSRQAARPRTGGPPTRAVGTGAQPRATHAISNSRADGWRSHSSQAREFGAYLFRRQFPRAGLTLV